jgi:GDP-L-fucose synthase
LTNTALAPLTPAYPIAGKKVFVAGHRGMVGSAIVRRLASEDCEIQTVDRDRLDLRDETAVKAWMTANKPQAIFLAAAKVGGIHANATYPADFIHDNLTVQNAVITAAARTNVEKLLFLGSSCIYPRLAAQPIAEEALLTGPLEPTNQWYAIAKIAGLKLCEALRIQYGCDFISAMPTNLYGPGDNYHPENSHVVPALIRRFHEAKERLAPTVTIWGTGSPRREFLYVDDAADALVFLMQHYSDPLHINVGSGEDVTILEFARIIAGVVGYHGDILTDPSRPDGPPRKLLDIRRIKGLGWSPRHGLLEGLKTTYADFLRDDAARRL